MLLPSANVAAGMLAGKIVLEGVTRIATSPLVATTRVTTLVVDNLMTWTTGGDSADATTTATVHVMPRVSGGTETATGGVRAVALRRVNETIEMTEGETGIVGAASGIRGEGRGHIRHLAANGTNGVDWIDRMVYVLAISGDKLASLPNPSSLMGCKYETSLLR